MAAQCRRDDGGEESLSGGPRGARSNIWLSDAVSCRSEVQDDRRNKETPFRNY